MSDLLELFGVFAVIIGTPLLAYLVYVLIQRFVVRGGRPAELSWTERHELEALRERVARLEQSVDVVAVEVERVGEAQRFTARLLAERPEAGVYGSPTAPGRVGGVDAAR